jgi:hypothetical protein
MIYQLGEQRVRGGYFIADSAIVIGNAGRMRTSVWFNAVMATTS